ncbi:MAG: bifunctional riboflavin kinase/FAD synthetase [bacterium]
MITLNDSKTISRKLDGCVITIGNFDGVHLGHRYILEQTISKAKMLGTIPVVMTFEPHPYKFFNPDEKSYLILPFEEKYALIKKIGVETIIVTEFTMDFARMSPHEYARRILKELINPSTIVVGHNFTFGRMASGDVSLLKTFGKEYGYNVIVVEPYVIEGKVVSSSKIRQYLRYGQIAEAKKFLGYNPYIKGRVVTGTHRGTNVLGFPTANIETNWELLPQRGVYAVKILLNNESHYGVANIGINPTFGGHELKIEVHILNFNRHIVGENLTVEFLQKIRDEMRFATSDELKQKIIEDIAIAKKIFPLDTGASYKRITV